MWSVAANEKEALAVEIQKKTYVASNQRGSGVDAQRINSQLSELKGRLSQADKELSDLDRELNAEEQLYSQEKMSVSLSAMYYTVVCMYNDDDNNNNCLGQCLWCCHHSKAKPCEFTCFMWSVQNISNGPQTAAASRTSATLCPTFSLPAS